MQNKSTISLPQLPVKTCLWVLVVLVVAAILAVLLAPKYKTLEAAPSLEHAVPLQLGGWQDKPSPFAQVSMSTYAQNLSDAVYDQVLMRTYEDQSKNSVMLALAFSREQRQEIKLHQPEICYPAQGYNVVRMQTHTFNIEGYPYPIIGKRLIFKNGNRMEAVSYWMRLGDGFPLTGMGMRWKILRDGLKGELDDGILVRVSTLIDSEAGAAPAYKIHENFFKSLLANVNQSAPGLLVPIKPSY